MEYTISVSADQVFIKITYHVPMTIQLARTSGPALLQSAAEYGVNLFLFDMRMSSNVETVSSNYNFAHHDMEEFYFPRDSKSAFLVRSDDHSHDFITTAFLNAGYEVAEFTSEDDAVAWLTA